MRNILNYRENQTRNNRGVCSLPGLKEIKISVNAAWKKVGFIRAGILNIDSKRWRGDTFPIVGIVAEVKTQIDRGREKIW